MFKFKSRRLVIALIITSLLITSTVYASGIKKNIEVAINSITVKLNGKTVTSDVFVYKGRTYIQATEVTKLFDKDSKWDEKNKVLEISDKVISSDELPTQDISDSKKVDVPVTVPSSGNGSNNSNPTSPTRPSTPTQTTPTTPPTVAPTPTPVSTPTPIPTNPPKVDTFS